MLMAKYEICAESIMCRVKNVQGHIRSGPNMFMAKYVQSQICSEPNMF